MRKVLSASLAWWGLLTLSCAHAATGPALSVKRIATGVTRPVFVTTPPGETNRLFILEQHSGRIRIFNQSAGKFEPVPYLTMQGLTKDNEQGLLGMAFHPNYMTNGFFYVNYTTTGGGPAGHTEVTRFRVQGDPATSNLADPDSKTVLLSFDQPEANHNGGWLGFGPDGYLYISTGDGGGAGDRHGTMGNGQNLNVLLGKILRIDVDTGAPYSIPEGNPFKGDTSKREEIWAFGLRNPWRCSFDRLTGDLWIGDVGQDTREEVDFAPAGTGGLNFGWRPREGSIQNPGSPNEQPVTPATEPIYDYSHGAGISITGGYVYRGSAIPGLQGSYFFADYGSDRFWSFRFDGTNRVDFQERTAELNSGSPKPFSGVSAFGEDGAGELYICDLDGEIYQIISTAPAGIHLSNMTAREGTFSFQFETSPGLSYVVESRESLAAGAWQSHTNVTGTAGSHVIVSDLPLSGAKFFRVRTE